MWIKLLTFFLGVLGELLISFIRNAQAARADNPQLIQYLNALVTRIEESPGLTGEQKRTYVQDNLKAYAVKLGVDLKDSIVNSLIELAVQKLKEAQAKTEAL